MADPDPGVAPATGTRLGPLVHRAVHHGAALWALAAAQFLVVMIAVEDEYPGYSVVHNYISDLGNTALSPWHDAFNGSVIVLGLLVVFGAILVQTAFPPRGTSRVGLALAAIAGLGAIGVGVFPENVNGTAHGAATAVAFVGGSFALILLGFAMFRDTRWDGFRAYTILSGLVGLVATALFLTNHDFALGVGGMERLVVAPILLWLLVSAIHLLYVPAYAPRILPRSPGV
jgi:hypothetical membrane protein